MFHRSFILFTLTTCFLTAKGQQLSNAVYAATQPALSRQPVEAAGVSVRITPSRTGTEAAESRAPNSWNIQGYELRTLVGLVYDFDTSRIVFADPYLAAKHYDLALLVPRCEQDEPMREHVRTALRQQLKLSIAEDVAVKEVYVMTAPHTPSVRLQQALGGKTVFSTTSVEIDGADDHREPSRDEMKTLLYRKAAEDISLDSISMASGTVDDLCTLLEQGLDRPVINETRLAGRYDVELNRGNLSRQEFFTRIWQGFGLRIERERRNVAVLRVGSERP